MPVEGKAKSKTPAILPVYKIMSADQSTKLVYSLSTAHGPSATLHGPGLLMLFAGPDRLLIGGQGYLVTVLAPWALVDGWG